MRKVKVLLAHPGTQHAKYLAVQLYKRNMLYKFCTGIMIPKNNIAVKVLLALLPDKIKQKINHRLVDVLPYSVLKLFAWNEYSTLRKINNPSIYREKSYFERNENFQRKIPGEYIGNCDVVIGFDTSSWILAEKAKKLNKKFILDQTTADPTGKAEIMQEVADTYPNWKFDLQPRYSFYCRTDHLEHELADRIVVASSYSKETLVSRNIPAEKIFVNPYGVDIARFTPVKTLPPIDLIKFLFVGSVSALKGIPLLLQAWDQLDAHNAELLIAGAVCEKVRNIIGERKGVKLLGSFSKDELPKVYQDSHVFVFPSFSEGFGLVILEAMASGLPVITTTATAGPDLIENGKEGFIISSGSSSQLMNSLKYFCDKPEKIRLMGKNAREKAERCTWEQYGKTWEGIIRGVTKVNSAPPSEPVLL